MEFADTVLEASARMVIVAVTSISPQLARKWTAKMWIAY